MFKATEYSWRGKQASGFTAFRRERRPSNPSIINNGLKFWYEFNSGVCFPNTNTTVTDLSTSGNNSTLQSTTAYSSVNDGVLSFNGTSDYAIGQTINLTSNGTISVWFKRTGTGTPDASGYADLVANVASDGTRGWTGGINSTTNKLGFYVANNGGFGTEDFSTQLIASNRWYHATFTYDGANKRIYINGAQDSVFASTVNGRDTTDNWGFGSRPTAILRRYFQGLIGSVALYDRALSASEVKLNFDATRVRYGV